MLVNANSCTLNSFKFSYNFFPLNRQKPIRHKMKKSVKHMYRSLNMINIWYRFLHSLSFSLRHCSFEYFFFFTFFTCFCFQTDAQMYRFWDGLDDINRKSIESRCIARVWKILFDKWYGYAFAKKKNSKVMEVLYRSLVYYCFFFSSSVGQKKLTKTLLNEFSYERNRFDTLISIWFCIISFLWLSCWN